MTEKFDRLILEILEQRRKSKSRYDNKSGLSSDPRNFRGMSQFSPSQRTKLGNTQYIGNTIQPRTNTSKKSSDEIHIARGIGSYVNLDQDSNRAEGSKINSKQNTEIQRNFGNGRYRIGPKNKYKIERDEH